MRLKRFILHEILFINMFKSREMHFKVINGLPDDARFVRWFQTDGRIEVVVESDSFEELKDEDVIPSLDPYPQFYDLRKA